MIPSDIEVLTDLTDGIDYQEASNINNPANKLARLAAFLLGTGTGAAQSHHADLMSVLKDAYTGGRCYKKDADEIYVSPFAGIVANAAGTVKKLRVSTSVTTLSAANLDTGSFAAATYYYIYATADATATTPTFVISASASAPTGYTYYRRIGWFYNETINVLDITGGKISTFIGGDNDIQVVSYQTGAYATGTTGFPYDNTIPQNTEGDQFMSLAITPTNANNKLKIDVVCFVNASVLGSNILVVALFQDSIANALACGLGDGVYNKYGCYPIKFTHYMIAGTTSSINFKVRAGVSPAATCYFNGDVFTGALYGGVIASSITITEVKA